MNKRLNAIHLIEDEQYATARNQWDTELGDYMRSAEKECAHYRDGTIEYSPTVSYDVSQIRSNPTHGIKIWYYHCLPALGVNQSIGHE